MTQWDQTLKSNVADYTGNEIGKISAPQTTLSGKETMSKSVFERFRNNTNRTMFSLDDRIQNKSLSLLFFFIFSSPFLPLFFYASKSIASRSVFHNGVVCDVSVFPLSHSRIGSASRRVAALFHHGLGRHHFCCWCWWWCGSLLSWICSLVHDC